MFSRFRPLLDVGSVVYLVSDNTVSEWFVNEVVSAGHSCLYKLKKNDSSSFCMFDVSRMGKDLFSNRDDALKELERRLDDKGKKFRKKI